MKAMIFAAGLGTRLRPVTDTIPKALVSVGGKPLIERLIIKLIDAGFNDIVINIHHFASQIKDFIAERGSFGINISFSDETDLLRETGGGIRHAADLLGNESPFLVHNVDIISNLELHNIFESHISSPYSPLATLVVSERQTQRYLLFNKQMHLVGWMNCATSQVRSPYKELARSADSGAQAEAFDPEAFLRENGLEKFAFAGVHVLSPAILGLMEKLPEKFSIIDFYLSVCDKYPILASPQRNLKMVDVGKVYSLAEAERLLAELDS